MCIVGSLSNAMLEDNNIQNNQISSNLEVNSKVMVSIMTYPNVIITDDNLHPKIGYNLEILNDLKKKERS